MNVRVDLLLPTERRSATPVRMRTLIRIAAGLLAALALLGLASVVQSYRSRRAEWDEAQATWKSLEPRQKQAEQMTNSLAFHRSVSRELQGWNGTRLPVTLWLEQLQAACPATIQLTGLRLSETAGLDAKNQLARRYTLRVEGRTGGPQADRNVRALQSGFTDDAPFSNAVESVTIPEGTFRQDPAPGATRSDRVFELEVQCQPRMFP